MPRAQATDALAGHVILVTGANGGLGSAVSLACARAGATVVLLGRRVPQLNRLYDAVVKEGPEPVLYPMDLEGAGPQDHADLAARIDAEFGRLDGLVHAAAHFDGLTPLLHADPAAVARALHVNLTAPIWLTQACLPLMQRTGAAIVWPIDTLPGEAPAYWGGYGLAHAARAAAVAQLRAELTDTRIRITGIEPGPMRTPLRAKAYVEGEDRRAREPAKVAEDIITAIVDMSRGRSTPQ